VKQKDHPWRQPDMVFSAFRALPFATAIFFLVLTGTVARRNPAPAIQKPVVQPSQPPAKARKSVVLASYGRLPLDFEENRGQTDQQVKFLARTTGSTLFLTSTAASWRYTAARGGVALRMNLVGSNPLARVQGLEESPGRSNYFKGSDPKKWRTNVPHYGKVEYQDIYPGVNLVYHGTQQQLEYDFVVSPGADPTCIALKFEGTDRVDIDLNGDLVLQTAAGEFRQKKPVIYQQIGSGREEVAGAYKLDGRQQVRFELGAYDPNLSVVIDPLVYSTYLGGTGRSDGEGIAIDSSGNAYVTGATASANFPTTMGAYSQTFGNPTANDEEDAFITKLNPTGTALVYSTYLGGNDNDQGNAIAVDSSGNAYIAGSTSSSNFPVTPGAYQNLAGTDTDGTVIANGFVTKLNSSGTALVYSTYFHKILSGNIIPTQLIGLSVVGGIAYVGGNTIQIPDEQMPPNVPEVNDCYIAALNPQGSGVNYTFSLAGTDDDILESVFADASGNVYVVGTTASTDFPTTPGAYQTSFGGGVVPLDPTKSRGEQGDGFVTKLNSAGTLIFSTYLGGSGNDFAEDVVADASGVYVGGGTTGNFPTTPGAFQKTAPGGFDMFAVKLNPVGSALIYSTYLGGSKEDDLDAIALDASGNLYIMGNTLSSDYPTTPGAYQTIYGGSAPNIDNSFSGDVALSKLNSTGTKLLYSTYLGGSGDEFADAMALDSSGNIYLTGATFSTNFPVTPGAFQTNCGADCGSGSPHAFVTKIDIVSGIPASIVAVSGDNQSGAAGSRLPASLVVKVVDGRNAPVTGATVIFTAMNVTVSPGSIMTDTAGTASTQVTLGTVLGPASVTATSGAATATFSFTVGAAGPHIAAGGLVGAGLSTPFVKALSSNAIATVYGDTFAPAGTFKTVVSTDLVNGRLPTVVNGVCVYVNNVRAPIFFLSPTQINFQVPQVATTGNVGVQVAIMCGAPNETRSNVESVASAAATPEFFYFRFSSDGKNPIAAINAINGNFIGPAGLIAGLNFFPANPGDFVTLFLTGGGITDPAFAPGELPNVAGKVSGSTGVSVAGVQLSASDILYVGVTPGFAGLYQLNIRIPAGTPQGSQPVVLTVGGRSSPAGYLFIGPGT
jgi:uncharacterized protein (TIGR03437 family)